MIREDPDFHPAGQQQDTPCRMMHTGMPPAQTTHLVRSAGCGAASDTEDKDTKPMNWKDYAAIAQRLKETLSESRYVHSLGVAYTASALAMRFGYPQEKALLAGLLHDCAKDLSDEENIALIRSGQMEPSFYELENPKLLHAKAGSVLARTQYGLTDDALLSAIRYHTTGRPAMTLIEKIIYVADYIEPKRDHADNLTQVRQLAFTDLDACICQILSDTVHHLSSTHRTTDPGTEETWRFYAALVAMRKTEEKSPEK